VCPLFLKAAAKVTAFFGLPKKNHFFLVFFSGVFDRNQNFKTPWNYPRFFKMKRAANLRAFFGFRKIFWELFLPFFTGLPNCPTNPNTPTFFRTCPKVFTPKAAAKVCYLSIISKLFLTFF
jgi:hypothetical protein